MTPWIRKLLEALDDEHRTLLLTFFNSKGCMDLCYQGGFFYQLSGPRSGDWPDYFQQNDTNMMVRAVTWWDSEPLWEGNYDAMMAIIGQSAMPANLDSITRVLTEVPPPPFPEDSTLKDKLTTNQKRTTVPVDQPVGLPTSAPETASPTTAISDAYLQRKAGAVPYLYIDRTLEQPYWIGRHEPCDTVINDLSISRKHCRIEQRNGSLYLIDNDSDNGSFVNEQRVIGESTVEPGDLVRIGRAMFILRLNPDKQGS